MGAMTANILGFREGLKSYEDVDLIRIISSSYNLLILKDYMPLLGEVEGRVEIVSGDSRNILEEVKGFFIHRSNQFELLLTEDEYVE